MENETVERKMDDVVNRIYHYEKEANGYNNERNYIMPTEITVTITLDEYRDLVSDLSKSEERISWLRAENDNLKDEVKKLKDEIKLSKDAEFIKGWESVAE